MAKKRKAARKSKAKRPAKKRTARLPARKVAKRKAKRAAPRKKQGVIASAIDSVSETLGLRRKLEGPNTFED